MAPQGEPSGVLLAFLKRLIGTPPDPPILEGPATMKNDDFIGRGYGESVGEIKKLRLASWETWGDSLDTSL